MKTLLGHFQYRHWTTQVLVTVGATTVFLMAFFPQYATAREAVALLTTFVWVWGK